MRFFRVLAVVGLLTAACLPPVFVQEAGDQAAAAAALAKAAQNPVADLVSVPMQDVLARISRQFEGRPSVPARFRCDS